MKSSNYLRQSKRRHSKSIVGASTIITGEDKIIGKETLASLMDVTLTSIERWIRDGMPVEQQGDQLADWVFNLKEVKTWKQDN
jgi:hypothetical protein